MECCLSSVEVCHASVCTVTGKAADDQQLATCAKLGSRVQKTRTCRERYGWEYGRRIAERQRPGSMLKRVKTVISRRSDGELLQALRTETGSVQRHRRMLSVVHHTAQTKYYTCEGGSRRKVENTPHSRWLQSADGDARHLTRMPIVSNIARSC